MITSSLQKRFLIFLYFGFAFLSVNGQEVTDQTTINKIRDFCYSKSFYYSSFHCFKKNENYLILPIKADSTCKSYSGNPVVVDTLLTSVIFGFPCPQTADILTIQKYNSIPWNERNTYDFDDYIRFDYEDYNTLRDYEYSTFDASLGGGYLLPRCSGVGCIRELAKSRFGIGLADTCYTISLKSQEIEANDPIIIYDITKPVKVFNLNLIEGDRMFFYGYSYFVYTSNPSAAQSYNISSSTGFFSKIDVDSSRTMISFTALKEELNYQKDVSRFKSKVIWCDINSRNLITIQKNQSDVTFNGLTIPPGSELWLSNNRFIALKPGKTFTVPGYPKFKDEEWIFFRSNHPSSYVFADTLINGKIKTFNGGIILNSLDHNGKIIAFHIKTNLPISIDNIEFAPNRWVSLDSNQVIGAGFLNRDQTVLGTPLLSIQNALARNNITPTSGGLPHAVKMVNGKVLSGYLSNNFDYQSNGLGIPLSSPGFFSINARGDLEIGSFYRLFNYKSHTYSPGEKILYNYIADKTITLFNEAELKAVLYYFQGQLQDQSKKELLKVANNSPLTGQYSDGDITQNTTNEYARNGFTIHNRVHVRNMIWQSWPLSDCDVDLNYSISLKWSLNGALNTYRFYLPSVWANNVGWHMSVCPLGPGAFELFGVIGYTIFAPFIQITPDIDVLMLQRQISVKIDEFKRQTNLSPLANVELTDLFIENNALKASFRYNTFLR